jgi:hypothetical protein
MESEGKGAMSIQELVQMISTVGFKRYLENTDWKLLKLSQSFCYIISLLPFSANAYLTNGALLQLV